MPFRVHPLWYSALIPVFFFITSIGLGLMAVVLDGFISAHLFDRKLHFNLLSQLGKIAAYVLWFYLILRLGDLAWRGVIPAGLDGSWQSFLFGAEILIGGILPATLLLMPRVRRSREGLITCGLLTTFGIVMQRMSLSMLTMRLPAGASYVPTLLEVAIAFAVPAAAGLLYFFFAENLAVLQPDVPQRQPRPYEKPQFDRGTYLYREDSFRNTMARRSGLAVFAIALTVAILPADVVTGGPPVDAPVKAALGWEMLAINGNRDQTRVDFDHLAHQQRLEESAVDREEICSTCHHLNKPNDEATACWECHQAMNGSTTIFDHTFHQQTLGGNVSCVECHAGEHTARTAAPCVECHDEMGPPPGQASFNDAAPGYEAAMHGACISCHQQAAESQNKPALGQCTACHRQDDMETVDVGEIEAARKLP
jgi:hypothetical protein